MPPNNDELQICRAYAVRIHDATVQAGGATVLDPDVTARIVEEARREAVQFCVNTADRVLGIGHEESIEKVVRVVKNIMKREFGMFPDGVRKFDEHGNVECHECGAKTARDYSQFPNLDCYACGAPMGELPDAPAKAKVQG